MIVHLGQAGDSVLWSPAWPVHYNDETRSLIAELYDTMDKARGVGLAAPQVGVSLQVFVFDDRHGNRGAVVNPRIHPLAREGQEVDIEGCLSVPGLVGPLPRYRLVLLTGMDEYGFPFDTVATDYLARIFQHECDHLRGILFLDRLMRRYQRKTHGT